MTLPQKKNILVIVDNDSEIHQHIDNHFKPLGYRMVTFLDTDEAIRECKISGSRWDVIVTDYQFPNMS